MPAEYFPKISHLSLFRYFWIACAAPVSVILAGHHGVSACNICLTTANYFHRLRGAFFPVFSVLRPEDRAR